MSFFPPFEPPTQVRAGRSVGPPELEVLGTVAVDAVLWREAQTAAWVSTMSAFSTGCEIEITCWVDDDDDLWGRHELRLGVVWPDGTKVSWPHGPPPL